MVSTLSRAPFPLPGRHTGAHSPEASSQPALRTAPCLQLELQNLSSPDESTEQSEMTDTKLSESQRDVAGTNELRPPKRDTVGRWGGGREGSTVRCSPPSSPSSLLEWVRLGCRGKAGRHEKMEIQFILLRRFSFQTGVA